MDRNGLHQHFNIARQENQLQHHARIPASSINEGGNFTFPNEGYMDPRLLMTPSEMVMDHALIPHESTVAPPAEALATSASLSATPNFSDHAFWTRRAIFLKLDHQWVEDTYENIYRLRPELHPTIFHDFGKWHFYEASSMTRSHNVLSEEDPVSLFTNINEEPLQSTDATQMVQEMQQQRFITAKISQGEVPLSQGAPLPSGGEDSTDDRFEEELDQEENGNLPEPALNSSIVLENGVLLTACTISTIHAINALPVRDESGGLVQTESTSRDQGKSRNTKVATQPIDGGKDGGKQSPDLYQQAAEGGDKDAGFRSSNHDATDQALLYPDASLCKMFKVDGDDDWEVELQNIHGLSQRYYDGLTTDFDRNPSKPRMNSEETAAHVRKQGKALAQIRKTLTTELGRMTAKHNCDKLAQITISVHKIGVPKEVYEELVKRGATGESKIAKHVNMICSERGVAVEDAIKANKRIAINVAKGHNLQSLAWDPTHAPYEKIKLISPT